MSGGFGYYDGDIFDADGNPIDQNDLGVQQVQQNKNPLRDHLKRVEDQLKVLQEQNAGLLAQQRQNTIADAFQAKGYAREAAGLYQGDPAKLDEWLTTYGPMLSTQPADTSAQGAGAQQGGAPASTVPAEGQAALQQMQQAGLHAAAPQGTDAEQIAAMRATQDPQALMQYLQSQGNQHYWNG